MRFKHLSLQGYKSFANKAEFLFPTGITAIVGPNGSGKSNIADAIRWVLGEQRMSSLRGKSTADMIYTGGRRRARAGMAEVTITLDNTDDWLPIDFSEVTITRRAHRSGENEYLINGSKVRLRDVAELLAEGGLSQHTYTVIGQGLVDAALSLRPQERRALFEEAAGIIVYRARREDALKRLEETQHNLERVSDIVGEITPRLRRLEREVKRVEENHRITAHLERLQRTWYGYHWGLQQGLLDQALERTAVLASIVDGHQKKATSLAKQMAEQRRRESELRTRLRDWHRESADLLEEANEARREMAVAEERARLLRAQHEELTVELGPLQEQEKTQEERVAQARARAEQLEQEVAGQRAQLEEREREWTAAQARAQEVAHQHAQAEQALRIHNTQIDRLNQTLAEAREEEAQLASERALAEERARQLQARHADLLAELDPLAELRHNQTGQVEQAQGQVTHLKQGLAEHRERLAEMEREWAIAQARAQELDRQRVQVEGALHTCRAQLDQLNQVLLEARAEEARLSGEAEALGRLRAASADEGDAAQALLQAGLDGVLGPLATLIQIPPEWERAIEAALGPDLQAIVVERAEILPEARRLAESAEGRLTLLPLDALHPPPPLPRGALRAADIATSDPHLRPAVESLLGTVALCDDLAEAQALLPAMPPGSRCATSSGLVLRADGAISIQGTDTADALAHERAWRELPARLAEARQRRQEIEDQQRAVAHQAASLEADAKDLVPQVTGAREAAARVEREKVNQARTESAVAEETLRSQHAALAREQAALERLQAQEAALLQQTQHVEAERAAILARLQELSGDDALHASPGDPQPLAGQIETARRRCQEIKTQLQGEKEKTSLLESRLEELTQQAEAAGAEAARIERETLAQSRMSAAVAEETLRSQRTVLQQETALLERLQAQAAARHQRAEELEVEHAAIPPRIQELLAEAACTEARLQQLRGCIEPAEEELARLSEAQTAIEEDELHARDRVRNAEARHGRAQLEIDRHRDELALLARRIEEDLGLVELELNDSVTVQSPLPLRPLVSQLPIVEELPQGLEEEIQRLKARLRRLGDINPNAPADHAEVQERHQFLTEQSSDLERASEQLHQVVDELDELMETAFRETFDAVAERFSETFTVLFDGGVARLELTEPTDLMNTGVDIVARPPGKRTQRLALLSGGERSLTAAALLFAILQVSPAPFCVLDEVDAMLDEANVVRFRAMLERLAEQTQFIIITHNRGTIEAADTLYGVSMGTDGISQVVSLKID